MSGFKRFSSAPANFGFGVKREDSSSSDSSSGGMACSRSAPTTVEEYEAIEISEQFIGFLISRDDESMYTDFLSQIQFKLRRDGTLNWKGVLQAYEEADGEGEKNHCRHGGDCRNEGHRHRSQFLHPDGVREQFSFVWTAIRTAFSYSMNVCGMFEHFKRICTNGISELRSGIRNYEKWVWMLITILLGLAILEAGGESDAINTFRDELEDILSSNLQFLGQFGVIVWNVLRAGGSFVGLINDVVYYTFFQGPAAFVKLIMSTFLACIYPAVAGIGAAFQVNPLVTSIVAVGSGPMIIRQGGSIMRLIEKNVLEYFSAQLNYAQELKGSINSGSSKSLSKAQEIASTLTNVFQHTTTSIGLSHLGPIVPISRKLEELSMAGKRAWVEEIDNLKDHMERVVEYQIEELDSNDNNNNNYNTATDDEGMNNNDPASQEWHSPGRRSKRPKKSKTGRKSKNSKKGKQRKSKAKKSKRGKKSRGTKKK